MARCRFVTPDVVRLPLSDGDWIDVKKELNAGESRKVFSDLVKDYRHGEKAQIDPEQVGLSQILNYVIAWSFVDAAGKPVPFSVDALKNLSLADYKEVQAAIDAHDEAVDQAQAAQKKERDGANKSSTTSPSAIS